MWRGDGGGVGQAEDPRPPFRPPWVLLGRGLPANCPVIVVEVAQVLWPKETRARHATGRGRDGGTGEGHGGGAAACLHRVMGVSGPSCPSRCPSGALAKHDDAVLNHLDNACHGPAV